MHYASFVAVIFIAMFIIIKSFYVQTKATYGFLSNFQKKDERKCNIKRKENLICSCLFCKRAYFS